MKLIARTLEHAEEKFILKVTTCNKRIVTTYDEANDKVVKFNRLKLEFMIKKGVFNFIDEEE